MRVKTGTALACAAVLLGAPGPESAAQTHLWSQSFGDLDQDVVEGVAVDGAGNVIMTGYFLGTVDFGGGPLTSGVLDIIVASYDENGSHNWSQSFGGSGGYGRGNAVAVDSEGNILITGLFFGSIDFGGGELVSNESEDILVAKFDNSGTHIWSRGYGGTTNQDEGLDIAVDPDGNVVVTGWFKDTLDFGGGPVTAAGTHDIFLLKLDADGNHAWSHAYGDSVDTGGEFGRGVATDGDGNIAITGQFDSEIDFGGGSLVAAGSQAAYLAKLLPDGSHQWSYRFGSALYARGKAVAFDTQGAVVATGAFKGSTDFGGGPLTPTPPSSDIFLIRYTGDGTHVWSQNIGGGFISDPFDIAIDNDDDSILISGFFSGTVDFGGGTVSDAGSSLFGDIFIASYNTYGAYRWSSTFGDTLTDIGTAVAIAPGNDVVMGGSFHLSVSFGGGALTATGVVEEDAFLVKFEGPAVSGIGDRPPSPLATLRQNAPNPFGPSTVIPFSLDRPMDVSLAIYDIAGRHVVTLLSQALPAASHTYAWNGRDASGAPVPSGVYFYRLSTSTGMQTRKAILIR